MTKLDILQSEINLIENLDIRQFTIKALEKAPDYFWEIPASSSGKYHPLDSLGKGGLVRHTQKVVYFAIELCRATSIDGDGKDIAISASLLHDTLKSGVENTGHTVDEHPLLPIEFYSELAELTGNYDDIMESIKTHMGIWGPKVAGPPKTKLQEIVHIADYLASRKEVYIKKAGKKSQQKDDPNYYLKHLREDLKDIIQKYLLLKDQEKEIKNEINALRKLLLDKMDESEEDILVSSAGVAKRTVQHRISYDPLLLKPFFKTDDLWEYILSVDNKKLKKLVKDKIIEEADLENAVSEDRVITYLRVSER